ncbi:serine hydrolase domain-containing protein [Dethiosulfatarculus sandiegensis]|uniref:Beta-lactamase-related domain-containing protein n=1 Tax=Dethiosulfatarculus sandiegensis TaxID=1429043 RepID=A0A0D2JHJ0_9BACT|nr:serine hydrolase domain-containing protein [Dethiosulfatarculus sandiegensis]KIX15211.1 hypothetical protein X474_05000 [Dethiosulfatarculus sandiegensis]
MAQIRPLRTDSARLSGLFVGIPLRFKPVFHIVVVLILLFTADLSWAEPAKFNPALAQRLDKCLQESLSEFKVPGVIAWVRGPKDRIWKGAAGWADLAQKIPMSPFMHMRIGSVTKTYTAMVILQLWEEGFLALDRPLADYLDFPITGGNKITIRHLLQMRSGLGNYSFNKKFGALMEDEPNRNFTPGELVKFSNYTVCAPGTRFDYNNANYIILGMIIEKLTKSSFSEQVKKRIIKPLGLKQTLVAVSCAMPQPFAKGYLFQKGKVVKSVCPMQPSVAWSAGNMLSTGSDQLVWAQAMAEGSLIKRKTRALQREFLNCQKPAGLAYGLGLARFHGGVGHTGNYSNAYTCIVMHYKGYDIVIMANGQAKNGNPKLSKASNIYAKLIKVLGL